MILKSPTQGLALFRTIKSRLRWKESDTVEGDAGRTLNAAIVSCAGVTYIKPVIEAIEKATGEKVNLAYATRNDIVRLLDKVLLPLFEEVYPL